MGGRFLIRKEVVVDNEALRIERALRTTSAQRWNHITPLMLRGTAVSDPRGPSVMPAHFTSYSNTTFHLDLPISIDILHMLGTNRVPSMLQLESIRNALRVLEADSKRLEEAAANGSNAAQSLMLKRDKMAIMTRELDALISPARKMPPEIMMIIFEYCLSDDHLSQPSTSGAPLILGHICSAWRKVALSTHTLWTSLVIHLPVVATDWGEIIEKALDTMQTWVRRSDPFPMSIALVDRGNFPINLMHLFAEQISAHSHRWRTMSFCLPSRCFIPLLQFTRNPLPLLENFTASHNDEMRVTIQTINLNLGLAPKVRSLSFTPHVLRSTDISMNWSQLTELSLSYEPSHFRDSRHDVYSDVLRQCSNLRTCSLGIGRPFGNDSIPQSVNIVLPHLQTLRVRRLSPESQLGEFFEVLVLPQLRELDIDSSAMFGWGNTWHEDQFPALLARSNCQLERLCIRDVDFPGSELLQCLLGTPHLKELTFMPCPRSQSIAEIVYTLMDENSLQHLETLQLGCSSESVFGPITGAIELRSGPHSNMGTKLRKFHLVFFDFHTEITPDRKRAIAKLRMDLQNCAVRDGQLVVILDVDTAYRPVYLTID